MKSPIALRLSLAVALTAPLLFSSCVSDRSHVSRGYVGGYATHVSLPPSYAGQSYYYNNRHHVGGRYETGRYSSGGRSYNNRYYHNGQYLYGGAYRQHPGNTSYQNNRLRPVGAVGTMTYQRNVAVSPQYSTSRPYAAGSYFPGYTPPARSYTGRTYPTRPGYQGSFPRYYTTRSLGR